MNYWRINTDSKARDDIRTCDLWYKFGMIFAGDFLRSIRLHDGVFMLLSSGDGVFMHHSGLGVVGYGIVKEEWDRKTYLDSERLLYRKEVYEYRISVNWDSTCDTRKNPLPISGRLPHMGTYCQVNPIRWNIPSVLDELRERVR